MDFKNCPCSGKNLAKLVRPSLLALLKEHSMHGYELAAEIKKHGWCGEDTPDLSGIYRILNDCEKSGQVVSHWDTPEHGGAKKVYSITKEGEKCLDQWNKTLEIYLVQLSGLHSFISKSC
ncbi:MAG: PadR family transcriptional regulator [Planctomycetia bacterium]|nr:PadR family transcriptional regulator [Planctomycetia bacterium]